MNWVGTLVLSGPVTGSWAMAATSAGGGAPEGVAPEMASYTASPLSVSQGLTCVSNSTDCVSTPMRPPSSR